MDLVGSLLCGHKKTEGIAKIALDQLAKSISTFSAKAIRYLQEDSSEESLNFGPFCARVLLENSCAALVGRLDCFRLLYLSEFQSQPDYEIGKHAKSEFSWTGDVFPDEKLPQDLWNAEHNIPRISRALFSDYLGHVYWKPAVERMLDFVASYKSDSALTDILQLAPEKFLPGAKGRSRQLYSTLSKGVHWEFFSSALLLDDNTVKTSIRDTCLLVGELGVTSHFIPTAYASLEPAEAIETYISFRKALI